MGEGLQGGRINGLHGRHTTWKSDYSLEELHGGGATREEGSHAEKTS